MTVEKKNTQKKEEESSLIAQGAITAAASATVSMSLLSFGIKSSETVRALGATIGILSASLYIAKTLGTFPFHTPKPSKINDNETAPEKTELTQKQLESKVVDVTEKKPAEIEEVKDEEGESSSNEDSNTFRIAFGTTTGHAATCSGWAESMVLDSMSGSGGLLLDVDRVDLATYDQDNLEQENIMVFIVSSWTGGTPPESCQVFFEWLKDMILDFRVDKNTFLQKVRFAVIGLGNSDYESDFCGAADKLDELLAGLGARRLCEVGKIDDSVDIKPQLEDCMGSVLSSLGMKVPERKKPRKVSAKPPKGKRTPKPVQPVEEEQVEEDEEDRINDMYLKQGEEELGDMEDMIVVGVSSDADGSSGPAGAPREMVTPSQRKSLTKEGYKIIGTHSAVKLCRWTKHHLRGRGGCYKHTFYGITSYQCMEATPSLACANKCVFCWRHHKNPVGKEWRWKQDEPDMIVEQAVDLHRNMIKQLKGVPGVQPERYQQAFTVRHCALSLVGEPIMYPRINEMIRELHKRSISSFLVTNAQFPQAIKDLEPVTQLYVSVDAASKDALKEVDRPLFKDFWERFTGSLEAIREKGQRTVYRLTLVKQWNMMEDELEGYAKLVELGRPGFIEIKAVTYCGKSDGSNLTMQNVPWHHEVRKFAEALCERLGGEYGTATEHVHSCCTLLARKDTFYKNGKWMTWINYDRFHELVAEYYATNGEKTFTAEDYMEETPSWALWGAEEEGFDPEETRFKRQRAPKNNEMPPAGLPRSRKMELAAKKSS